MTCNDLHFKYNEKDTSLAAAIEKIDPDFGNDVSHTIQHLTLTADTNVRVGDPVFMTGEVVGKNFTPLIVSSTDCVPLVKSTGDWSTFVGICTEVDVPYKNNTTKILSGKRYAFVRYATHGDFQMGVKDSSQYMVGDLITFDGHVVAADTPLNLQTMYSIVGSVSAIIDEHSVAVFRI